MKRLFEFVNQEIPFKEKIIIAENDKTWLAGMRFNNSIAINVNGSSINLTPLQVDNLINFLMRTK